MLDRHCGIKFEMNVSIGFLVPTAPNSLNGWAAYKRRLRVEFMVVIGCVMCVAVLLVQLRLFRISETLEKILEELRRRP